MEDRLEYGRTDMKFLKKVKDFVKVTDLKDKVKDTVKAHLKQRAMTKITKLMLKSRPDAAALLSIIDLARDIKKGRK